MSGSSSRGSIRELTKVYGSESGRRADVVRLLCKDAEDSIFHRQNTPSRYTRSSTVPPVQPLRDDGFLLDLYTNAPKALFESAWREILVAMEAYGVSWPMVDEKECTNGFPAFHWQLFYKRPKNVSGAHSSYIDLRPHILTQRADRRHPGRSAPGTAEGEEAREGLELEVCRGTTTQRRMESSRTVQPRHERHGAPVRLGR